MVGSSRLLSRPSRKGGIFLVELEDLNKNRRKIIKVRSNREVMSKLEQFIRS